MDEQTVQVLAQWIRDARVSREDRARRLEVALTLAEDAHHRGDDELAGRLLRLAWRQAVALLGARMAAAATKAFWWRERRSDPEPPAWWGCEGRARSRRTLHRNHRRGDA
jgi:hypothetical protein